MAWSPNPQAIPQFQALDAIREAAAVTDPEGIVRYWNAAATALFGWRSDERIGRPLAERFPTSVRPALREHLHRITATGAWDGEFEDWRKDETRLVVAARVRPLRDEAGGWIGNLHLARELQRAPRPDGAEDIESVLAIARVGLWSLDLADGSVEWSPESCRVLGVAGPHGTLASWQQLVHADDRAVTIAKLESTIRERGAFRCECRIRRPDGSERWIANFARVECAVGGEPTRVVGTLQDITERVAA
ncbi:MAG: PAS domain-containing protein, partial [Planctomycetes bacterium]|nr:PAS domain-containing protein [Planctomycetota bacterium]